MTANNRLNSTILSQVHVQRWPHVVRRGAAYAVDLLIVFAAFAAGQSLLFPLVGARYGDAFAQNGLLLELYVLATISLPIWLYFILLERSRWHATLGKRLLGIRVTSVSSPELTTGQLVLRTAGKLLPWEMAHFAVNVPTSPVLNPATVFSTWRLVLLGLVYLLLFVYLISVIRQPLQTLYDRIAGTAVIPAIAEN